jgi:hypothetical protein
MNSNAVLGKIMTLLSLDGDKEEIKLAFARLADGTVLESPSFDVGERVDVLGEDGEKTPAPDGEHELELRDTEGEETTFKIFVEDGIIRERENVELEAETIEVEPLPNTTDEDEANKVDLSEESANEEVQLEQTEVELEEDEEEEELTAEEKLGKKMDELIYRMEEIEKRVAEMAEHGDDEEEKMEEEEELEDEDDKLDGAPVEMSKIRKSSSKKSFSSQDKFLSKLYK